MDVTAMKRTKTNRNSNANETKNKHICYPSPVLQTATLSIDVTENTRLKEKTGSKTNQSVDK